MIWKNHAALVAGLLVLIPASASGQQTKTVSVKIDVIPKSNVEANCRAHAWNQMALNKCIEDEQLAYDVLNAEWRSSPEEVRASCLAYDWHLLQEKSPWFYTGLEACMSARLEQWRLMQPHTFKR
jgi:hypothetical protein